MCDESNPLFRVLDAAGGTRDGEFIRALARLVDTGAVFFEPDVEFGVRDAPEAEEYVNIRWGFSVRRSWLTSWIEGAAAGDGAQGHARDRRSARHRRPKGPS